MSHIAQLENIMAQDYKGTRNTRSTFLSEILGIATVSDLSIVASKLDQFAVSMSSIDQNLYSFRTDILDIHSTLQGVVQSEHYIANSTKLNRQMIVLTLLIENIEDRTNMIFDILKTYYTDSNLEYSTIKHLNLTNRMALNKFYTDNLKYRNSKFSFQIYTPVLGIQHWIMSNNSDCICKTKAMELCVFLNGRLNRFYEFEMDTHTILTQETCAYLGFVKKSIFFPSESIQQIEIQCEDYFTKITEHIVWKHLEHVEPIRIPSVTKFHCKGWALSMESSDNITFFIGNPDMKIQTSTERAVIETVLFHKIRFPTPKQLGMQIKLNPPQVDLRWPQTGNNTHELDFIWKVLIVVNGAFTIFLVVLKIIELMYYMYTVKKVAK